VVPSINVCKGKHSVHQSISFLHLFCLDSPSPTLPIPYHQRIILSLSQVDPSRSIASFTYPSVQGLESTYQSSPDFTKVLQRQVLQSSHQDARQDPLRPRDTHPHDHRNAQPHDCRLHDERLRIALRRLPPSLHYPVCLSHIPADRIYLLTLRCNSLFPAWIYAYVLVADRHKRKKSGLLVVVGVPGKVAESKAVQLQRTSTVPPAVQTIEYKPQPVLAAPAPAAPALPAPAPAPPSPATATTEQVVVVTKAPDAPPPTSVVVPVPAAK
jgi:hypothetical protein